MRSSRIVVAHMKFYIMSYSCHPSLRMLLVRTVPLLTTSIFWRHRTTCNYGDSRSNIRTGRQVVCHGQFHFQVQRLHDLYLCPKTEGWFHVCHTTLLPVYKIVSSSCKQTKHEHPSQTSTSVSWNASSHRNITSPILSTLWTSKGFLWRDWMHYPAPSHQYILYVNVPKGSVDPSTSYYCQQSRLRVFEELLHGVLPYLGAIEFDIEATIKGLTAIHGMPLLDFISKTQEIQGTINILGLLTTWNALIKNFFSQLMRYTNLQVLLAVKHHAFAVFSRKTGNWRVYDSETIDSFCDFIQNGSPPQNLVITRISSTDNTRINQTLYYKAPSCQSFNCPRYA